MWCFGAVQNRSPLNTPKGYKIADLLFDKLEFVILLSQSDSLQFQRYNFHNNHHQLFLDR